MHLVLSGKGFFAFIAFGQAGGDGSQSRRDALAGQGAAPRMSW